MGQKVVNVCLERIHRRLMKRQGESRVRAWTGYLWLEVEGRQERVVVHIWREGRGGGEECLRKRILEAQCFSFVFEIDCIFF